MRKGIAYSIGISIVATSFILSQACTKSTDTDDDLVGNWTRSSDFDGDVRSEANIVGSQLADTTGQAALTASPIIDHIYGLNNYYRFNITNFINSLLHTAGSAGDGFFVMESIPEQAVRLDRAVFGDVLQGKSKAQLTISIVTVNLE